MPINRESLQLMEVVSGAHFHSEITLTSELAEKYYRQVTRVRSGLFTARIFQPGAPLVLVNESEGTKCVVTESSLNFFEEKHHDQERFNKNVHSILSKLVEVFEMNSDNFRVLGKVSRYHLRHSNVFETYKKSVGMFAADEIQYLNLRTNLREGDKNIHIEFRTIEKDGKPVTNDILLACDINNVDQTSRHSIKLMDEIFAFADEYNEKSLLDLLNQKLKVE